MKVLKTVGTLIVIELDQDIDQETYELCQEQCCYAYFAVWYQDGEIEETLFAILALNGEEVIKTLRDYEWPVNSASIVSDYN